MAKARSGGGITGKNVTRQSVRTGQPAREMRPKGVSQIGQAVGNHAMDSGKILRKSAEAVRGERNPAGGPGGVRLGNEVALNVGKGGAGAGRTIHPIGGQGQHGAVSGTPGPAGRDILGAFGPESAGVRGRR
jgi:hypothetical protein